jgi:hypothetical protein
MVRSQTRRRWIPQSWVGFHSFRHTAASAFFRAGWNAKQVQLVLGHHSPAFTLATYVHLIADDLPELPEGWQQGGNQTGRDRPNGTSYDRPGFSLIAGETPDEPRQTETAGAFS